MNRSPRCAVVLVALLIAACGREPAITGAEVARVDGKPILRAEWQAHLESQAGGEGLELDSRVLSQLLDQYLDEWILLKVGIDGGWVSPEASLAEQRKELLDELSRATSTPAEEARWIEQNPEALVRPERVRVLHFVRADLAEAESDLEELEALGADAWRDRGPSVEISDVAIDQLPLHLVDAVSGLELHHRGAVAEGPKGYSVVWLMERIPARRLSGTDAMEVARAALARRRAEARRQELVEAGRDRYNARVWRENLPFDYRGPYGPASPGDSD